MNDPIGWNDVRKIGLIASAIPARLKSMRGCAFVCKDSHVPSQTNIYQIETMILPQLLSFLIIVAPCLSLSIPSPFSILQQPAQNQTSPSPSSNQTSTWLGAWPTTPFKTQLDSSTDMEIISRKPSSTSDPTSDFSVLEAISFICAKARGRGQLPLLQDFDMTEGPVSFRLHAMEDDVQYVVVRKVLDQMWQMTNLHGKGGVYGRLLRGDHNVAFFELVLQEA